MRWSSVVGGARGGGETPFRFHLVKFLWRGFVQRIAGIGKIYKRSLVDQIVIVKQFI